MWRDLVGEFVIVRQMVRRGVVWEALRVLSPIPPLTCSCVAGHLPERWRIRELSGLAGASCAVAAAAPDHAEPEHETEVVPVAAVVDLVEIHAVAEQ